MEYVCNVLRDGLSRFSGHELEHFVEKRQRDIDRIAHSLGIGEAIGVTLCRIHRSRKVDLAWSSAPASFPTALMRRSNSTEKEVSAFSANSSRREEASASLLEASELCVTMESSLSRRVR
jgi:hypothetical protein